MNAFLFVWIYLLDNVRRCELAGTVYDQAFSVYFEILESKLLIQTLSFTVSVDMQVDTGPLLEP